MTDITKCDGENCKKRDTCYRFTAPHDPLYQSYFADKSFKNCEHYWQVATVKKSLQVGRKNER